MKTLSRRNTLIAGVALIALTNTVALVGVGVNRSGEPESQLRLSQRELQRPYGWGLGRESSGLALRLAWRIPAGAPRKNGPYWSYEGAGGAPSWLNRAKMHSLGFDLPATALPSAARLTEQQLSREVFLVLELDGPASRAMLAQIQNHAQAEVTLQAANPDNAEFKQRAKNALDRLKQEDLENSRLFVVDAGQDLSALRSQYPNRSRYAMVRGQVRPWTIDSSKDDEAAGFIHQLSIDRIHVPFAFRAGIEAVGQSTRSRAAIPLFEATVAFGQRLEPWITAASVAPK